MVEGLGDSGIKIIFLSEKNGKFGCILPQFFTGREHGTRRTVSGSLRTQAMPINKAGLFLMHCNNFGINRQRKTNQKKN